MVAGDTPKALSAGNSGSTKILINLNFPFRGMG